MFRRGLVFSLVVLVALGSSATVFAADPSSGGNGLSVVKGSAAQDEYGDEDVTAGQQPTSEEVFTPPVVLSASEADDAGTLPLTGAALAVPTILGAALLGVGLVLLYRTRRRDT